MMVMSSERENKSLISDWLLFYHLQEALAEPVELGDQFLVLALEVLQFADFLLFALGREAGVVLLAGSAFEKLALAA